MMPTTQQGISQPVESNKPRAGKSRVKARQLSQALHRVIIERFHATASSEDVAEELRIPARTVSDVVMAAILRRAPEPERGAYPNSLRRSA